jgi:hypothetical protein
MSFVNIDCQPFAVSVQQPVLFIEWPFLEDDVDHLSDHNWAQSCHYTPQKACPVGYIGVSGL